MNINSKRIVIFLPSEEFFKLFFALGTALEYMGFKVTFFTFHLRENILLKKNGVRAYPKNVFSLDNHIVDRGLLTKEEVQRIFSTAIVFSPDQRELIGIYQERLLKVASYVNTYMLAEKPALLIMWGGADFLLEASSVIAKRNHIKVLFLENGYFNDTLQVDSVGVNIRSSIFKLSFTEFLSLKKPSIDYCINTLPDSQTKDIIKLSLRDRFYCFFMRVFIRRYYDFFPELKGGNYFSARKRRILNSMLKEDKITLPEKFIFIPLQVHDDTQILFNSPNFKDIEHFIVFCYQKIRDKFGNDYKIVIKEHPEDIFRQSYAHLKEKYKDIIWLRKYNLELLLDKSSMVFVINSSVGLQALARHKVVVIFGNCFYAYKEIAFKVDRIEDVDKVLDRAKNGLTADQIHLIDKFVEVIKEKVFIAGGWRRFNQKTIKDLVERIIGNLSDKTP